MRESFFLFSLSVGFFVVNIREVFFYFVRKNRASQYVSVRVYFVAFKKFFFL